MIKSQMERLEKGKIINLNNGETFVFQFNPEEYTISKPISWTKVDIVGKKTSETQYSNGQPASLNLNLFFDTSDTGLDVRVQYAPLLHFAEPQSLIPFLTLKEPPRCRFIWGKIPSFTAVITNISQNFVMFLGDGTPVRAKVTVELKEVKDKKEENEEKSQNPTSRSEPRRTRRVQLGDRLDLIAFEEYGDTHYWLDIALANDLEDPLRLEPGQILNIPVF